MFSLSGAAFLVLISGILAGNLPSGAPSALADSSSIVSIYHDGLKKAFALESGTVGDALEVAGVELGQNDIVEPSAETVVGHGYFNINVYRARPVTIIDQGKTIQSMSARQSPKLIAEEAGLKVYTEDTYSSETVTDFVSDEVIGHKIIIDRATPVVVSADHKVLVMRTQAEDVDGLLKDKRISLGVKDVVTPSLKTALTSGMSVSIKRVSEAVVEQEEVIPREVKTIKDPTQHVGYRAVTNEGADGSRKVSYLVHYENGAEQSRQILSNKIVKAAVSQVVVVGTRVLVDDEAFYRLRLCESGNNYAANTGNGYYGAYQFDLTTWRSNGGTGYPHHASPATQDEIAKRLQARRGWAPWPSCSRKLGLR